MNNLRVQVMVHHGLGDFLMAVPLLRALLARQEPIRLDVIVKSRAICDFAERILRDERITWFVLPNRKGTLLLFFIMLRRRRPWAFLGVHAKGRVVGRLAQLTGATLRVGPVVGGGYNIGALEHQGCFSTSGVYDERVHKVYQYLMFGNAIVGETKSSPELFLECPKDIQECLDSRFPSLHHNGPVIGIAPGCGLGIHKRWHGSGYAEVIDYLAKKYSEIKFVILGDRGEEELGQAISSAVQNDRAKNAIVDLTGQLSLCELFALLKRLSLLVAVCNGPSHMAAAAGTPIVGIYGPTNPGFTGAFSDRLYIVRKEYSCSPCYRAAFNTGCGDVRCMKDITAIEVERAVSDLLSGKGVPDIPALENTLARGFCR